jgi:acyl-CoA reductase-like NAD-dependent aldehyde dehydrogenase
LVNKTDVHEEAMGEHHADQVLDLANWAAAEYASYSRETVLDIARAAAKAGESKAGHYAEWVHRETGVGVVEHETIANRLCSNGIFDHYKDQDFVNYRVDGASKTIAVPKPVGVVCALAPPTNPVATVSFEVLLCLLTRNAIVVGAHPAARACTMDAALGLAEAAEQAGAPKGTIQVLPGVEPDVVDHIMGSTKAGVVVASAGTAMPGVASSEIPAIELGAGNVPAYVDRSADVPRAAKCLTDSKAFGHGLACTSESVVIAHKDIAQRLQESLVAQGAHFCSGQERERLEQTVFPLDRFNTGLLGKSATEVAAAADIKVADGTRVLVVPLQRTGDDYPMSREKPCPVVGYLQVQGGRAGIQAAQSMLRYSGTRHSAVLHARDTEVILRFAAALDVLHVAVNTPGSAAAGGLDTPLASSMTVGTGVVGRGAAVQALHPQHLVNWTRMRFDKQSELDEQSFLSARGQ